MTDLLLLIIIGKMFNFGLIYWIIIAIIAIIAFLNTIRDIK